MKKAKLCFEQEAAEVAEKSGPTNFCVQNLLCFLRSLLFKGSICIFSRGLMNFVLHQGSKKPSCVLNRRQQRQRRSLGHQTSACRTSSATSAPSCSKAAIAFSAEAS